MDKSLYIDTNNICGELSRKGSRNYPLRRFLEKGKSLRFFKIIVMGGNGTDTMERSARMEQDEIVSNLLPIMRQ